MNIIKSPCERCTDRNPTCHIDCQKGCKEFSEYLKWIAQKRLEQQDTGRIRRPNGIKTL